MIYINTNKLEKKKLTDENYYILLDFDKTITNQKSLDSWVALIDEEIYGEACQKEIEQLNGKYEPIELDYILPEEQKEQYMVEWYQKSMDILYKYHVTYSNLMKALQKNKLEFRRGAKEFFKKAQQKNIPIIILSAGIGNVIEEFLKKQECYYENMYIISNFITFQEDKMQKFTKPLIHTMNKRLEGKLPQELQQTIGQKQYAILCGDMIEDIHMLKKEALEQTITIGFLNRKIEDNLSLYRKNYDIVLTEEEACFQEVEKIVKMGKEEK